MALEKTINIKIDSTGVKTSIDGIDKSMKSMGKTADKANKTASSGLNDFKLKAVAAAVAVAGITTKLVNVAKKFQTFEASLKTATGSAENAALAMEALQDFAATTPFSIDKSIEAFVKLRNLGLDPSEKALESYGNTSVALGKDLDQMIEAVADAATGEFERLKEFGIKAKSQGDQVSFTFQGVTTTVGKNAAEIEGFLQGIGETNFAGAMAEQFNSLSGLMSNFGDNIDKVMLGISEMGTTSVITDLFTLANESLEQFNTALSSGEVEATLSAIGSKFEGLGEDITFSIEFVGNAFNQLFNQLPIGADNASGFISDAFSNFPENIRAFIQLAVVNFASFIDDLHSRATFAKESLAALFTDDTLLEANKRFHASQKAIQATLESSETAIFAERDAALKSFDGKMAASVALTEQYKKESAARKEASREAGGTLGQFKIKTTTPEAAKEDDPQIAKEAFRTANLKAELNERLEAQKAFNNFSIQEFASVAERERAIVELNKELDIADLEARIAEEELEFTRRREAILENEKLDSDAKKALQAELKQQELTQKKIFEAEKVAIENEAAAERKQIAIDEAKLKEAIFNKNATAILGAVAELGKRSVKIQKAVSIAQSGIAIATGIARAQELGFPANLAEIARVVALGAKVMNTIRSTEIGSAPSVGGATGGGGATDEPITAQRQEPASQQSVLEVRGLSEIAEELRNLDPGEVLPVEYTQRIVASLTEFERLSGESEGG